MERATMATVLNGVATIRRRAAPRSLCSTAILISLTSLAGCSPDIFGPDTETGHFVVTGFVTSAFDGAPIEGAKVYPVYFGWLVGGGEVIVPDTAVTDAAGRYRLDTESYCDSQIWAQADGYTLFQRGLGFLGCEGNAGTLAIDIVFQPSDWVAADHEPAWSHNGSEIAVSSSQPGAQYPGPYDIRVIDALGNTVQLTSGFFANFPSWSPDGLRIAFSGADVSSSLYVMNRDGSELTNLATIPESIAGGVAWSPDGATIAFGGGGDGQETHLFLFDFATSVVTKLTEGRFFNRDPSWSPDGSQVVFASTPGDRPFQIYRMEADGSGVVRLSDLSAGAIEPAWSPCGTEIAFSSLVGSGSEIAIHVMDSDGQNVRVLTDNEGDDWAPAWSPDCSKIAFSSTRTTFGGGSREIWVMNADGSGLEMLPRSE